MRGPLEGIKTAIELNLKVQDNLTMKSTPTILALSLLLLIEILNANGQLVVDAGTDTILCDANTLGYVLGGNPTALGGSPPYTYKWSCEYVHRVGVFYASSFLDDTSTANPVIKSGFDTLNFRLQVAGENDAIGTDSVTLIHSSYVYCLGDCMEYIDEGDSVKLYHCVMGGIQPFSYSWEPQESLSDPNIPGPWAKPSITTRYVLTIIDSAGCSTTSSCKVNVLPTSNNQSLSSDHVVRIHPNPTTGMITIKIGDTGLGTITISALNGEILLSKVIADPTHQVNLSPFRKGIYFITVRSQEFVTTRKVIKLE